MPCLCFIEMDAGMLFYIALYHCQHTSTVLTVLYSTTTNNFLMYMLFIFKTCVHVPCFQKSFVYFMLLIMQNFLLYPFQFNNKKAIIYKQCIPVVHVMA